MKEILKFLLPLSYPLVMVWHIILAAFAVGLFVILLDLEINTALALITIILGLLMSLLLFLFGRGRP